MKPEVPADGSKMSRSSNKVSIADVRDVIKFSGINIVAQKSGSGLIHVYAENAQDLSNFSGVAIVNRIKVQVSVHNASSGYIDGMVA